MLENFSETYVHLVKFILAWTLASLTVLVWLFWAFVILTGLTAFVATLIVKGRNR